MALEELTVLDPDDVRSSLFAWGFALNYGIVVGNPQPLPIPEQITGFPLVDCFRAMGEIVPRAKHDFERSCEQTREVELGFEYKGAKAFMQLTRDDPFIRGILLLKGSGEVFSVMSFDVKSDAEQVRGYIGKNGALWPITAPYSTD